MNPLSVKEKETATATHKAALNIGEVWGLLTTKQKRGVLEEVLDKHWPGDFSLIEKAINGDKRILLMGIRPGPRAWINYRNELISEILTRGGGAFAACINGVPGFENASRDIMWEMVSEGQVVDEGGQPYA